MSNKTGGRAFPCDSIVERDEVGHLHGFEVSSGGMTLRDYFAAKALQGLCANPGGPFQSNDMNGWATVNCDLNDIAVESYKLADAMLLAREAS